MTIPFTDIDKLYIDGVWQPVADREAVLNPATEEVIGNAPMGGTAEAEAAIASARAAFDHGPWPRLAQAERAAMMRRMHDALVARSEQIISLIIAEVGCTQGIARAMQVEMPLNLLRRAIEAFDREEPRALAPTLTPSFFDPTGPKIFGSGVVIREPIGVVTGITGYNFPVLLNLAKITPALLAGNTLVLKPSPFTPFSALLFGAVADEIGLPKGVLNIVTGGPEVGTLLTTDPRIDMVTFTGSEAVGAAIMAQAAPTLKRVHLELGGKSALIVREDADIAAAAAGAIMMLTSNCGQGCAVTSRFVVHNAIRRSFVEAARAIASQWKIGNPADASVLMGPLIRESQRSKVERLVQVARDEGARLIHGGGRPAHLSKGFFVDVTLFDDVDNRSTIAQEEVFGPVGAVMGFDSDEEAIQIANDSHYGLNGGILTADGARAYEMALQIRTGSIAINGGSGTMPWAPFGGYKRSGIGREYGSDWLREFQQEKTIAFPAGR